MLEIIIHRIDLNFVRVLWVLWVFCTIDQENNTKNMALINDFLYHPGSSGNMVHSNNGNSGGLHVLLFVVILLAISYIALFIAFEMRCPVVSKDNFKDVQKEEMDEECWSAELSSTLAAKFVIDKGIYSVHV